MDEKDEQSTSETLFTTSELRIYHEKAAGRLVIDPESVASPFLLLPAVEPKQTDMLHLRVVRPAKSLEKMSCSISKYPWMARRFYGHSHSTTPETRRTYGAHIPLARHAKTDGLSFVHSGVSKLQNERGARCVGAQEFSAAAPQRSWTFISFSLSFRACTSITARIEPFVPLCTSRLVLDALSVFPEP